MLPHDSETIQLHRSWHIGKLISTGGFGKIYTAYDEDGLEHVIKFVPREPGADRELLFGSLSSKPHIIPILDTGEWGNYYALVMPRANKSLREHLHQSGNTLPSDEALDILLDIAEALASVEKDVVHRDLKPENILLYQGHWCLADFGIARYAEASTSTETHKYAFTSAYAAPEQWRHIHTTPATDIYAFGIIAFEILQGHHPFPGPTHADYQQQHLHQQPPILTNVPPSVGTLISECLRKMSQTRPTATTVVTRLRRNQQPSSPAALSLQIANRSIVEQQAQTDARDSAQQTAAEMRKDIENIARYSFENIIEQLVQRIRDAASSVNIQRSSQTNITIQLGKGTLTIDTLRAAPANCLQAFTYPAPFDVIAYSMIQVKQPRNHFGYEGRSHSLWFCDAHEEGVYRWFETAFMIYPLIPRISLINPFAFPPTSTDAAEAFSPTTAEYQVAWEPLPFDQGDEEQFLERWIGLFARSAQGTLQNPSSMPENSGGKHRRAQQ